jgi:NAD(P)-dependent dehydrogenase (short-subunit alcohol dehydrogenase family)
MKTIIMTGATSGLGAIAARIIADAPDTDLLIGSRGKQLDGIKQEPLDLARLSSVRSFASAAQDRLGDTPIDVLILNAGVTSAGGNPTTEDGYETVFATNHLAHYLLLRLLTPRLSPTAIVVITTSDTHEPRINKLAPPQHAYADLLSAPPGPQQGFRDTFRAYASSKLCYLLTARALARNSAAQGSQFTVVAYNPGFTPGTELSREANRGIRTLTRVAVPVVGRFIHINTVAETGTALADLALGNVRPPQGRIYASLSRGRLTWPDPSPLARSDDAMISLWQQTAALLPELGEPLTMDAASGRAANAGFEPA